MIAGHIKGLILSLIGVVMWVIMYYGFMSVKAGQAGEATLSLVVGLLIVWVPYSIFYMWMECQWFGWFVWIMTLVTSICGGCMATGLIWLMAIALMQPMCFILAIWHLVCLLRMGVFYRLNCRKKGSNKGKDVFIIAPVFNIITSVFNFFARILHLVIRIFIRPDPEQRKKVQRRNVWALSLWGDVGRVEIVPSHTNTPWRMSPERYKRICSDVSAVDTVPFEITSPAHGAGEMWYIIPEGGTDFVVLLDKKPIRGKTPINAGNKVALWKKRKGTVIGHLEVKRRMLVETKSITSSRMKR